MSKILGEYHVDKSTLISQEDPSLRLLVRSRANPTPYKPANFILRPLPGGRVEYLSSLFPLPKGSLMGREGYSIDYNGEYLVMEVDMPLRMAWIRRRKPGEYTPLPVKKPPLEGQNTPRKRSNLRSRKRKTT